MKTSIASYTGSFDPSHQRSSRINRARRETLFDLVIASVLQNAKRLPFFSEGTRGDAARSDEAWRREIAYSTDCWWTMRGSAARSILRGIAR